MIQLIVGHKGSGKTKAIVEMANKAVKESKGYVVVIEKDVRLTYEISSAARLVYSDEYAIAGYDAVYGFITGLLAGNYDITEIFVDATLRIGGRNMEELAAMIEKLDKVSESSKVSLVFTVSCDISDLPESIKRFVI